ncbi:MAG: hypothetical protein MJ161_03020 [Clostridia bacterium]|nr:hypothetical protein [Clostridia bacterium]
MKRRIALLTAALLLLVSFGLAFAAALEYSGSRVFRNEFNTSGVNLKLEQYRVTDRGIARAVEGTCVAPGERVSYIPRVTNLEADSFIRVTLDLTSDGDDIAITPDCFFGIGENWVRKGNCFYCRDIFRQGESADVISGIVVPYEMESGGGQMRIRATADAIQAKNFSPDFAAANPWGTVEIQTLACREGDRGAICRGVVKTQSLDFSFAREGIFECSTEDLFSKFDSFQPGDKCSETLDMRNKSGEKLTVHFRTENVRTDLLDEMKLSISCCGKKVYSGPLTSEELASFMEIGTIENGRAGKLEFEISMPREADNRYSMLEDNVTWIIAVSRAGKEEASKAPLTGEKWLPLALAALGVSGAMLAAVITVCAGRRKGHGDD